MKVRNEQAIACVKVDIGDPAYGQCDHYACIVRNEGGSHAPLGRGLAFLPAHRVIQTVCAELAADTVDGTLRVNGRRVTPEAYIRRWREALMRPASFPQLAREWRVSVEAVFEWQYTAAMASTRSPNARSPFATLGELLMSYSDRVHHVATSAGNASLLRIDLSSPNGPRDAWWAENLILRSQNWLSPPKVHIETSAIEPALIESQVAAKEA